MKENQITRLIKYYYYKLKLKRITNRLYNLNMELSEMRMEYRDMVSKISHPTLYDDTPVENERELCEYLTCLSYDILVVEESIANTTIEKLRLSDKIKTNKSS